MYINFILFILHITHNVFISNIYISTKNVECIKVCIWGLYRRTFHTYSIFTNVYLFFLTKTSLIFCRINSNDPVTKKIKHFFFFFVSDMDIGQLAWKYFCILNEYIFISWIFKEIPYRLITFNFAFECVISSVN